MDTFDLTVPEGLRLLWGDRYLPKRPLTDRCSGPWLVRDTGTGAFRVCRIRQMKDGQLPLEASVCFSLFHPGLPALLDLRAARGRAFLIFSCLDGKSLDTLAKQGRMRPEKALSVLTQAASLAAILHRMPGAVVHGDISPANLLLCEKGLVSLVDLECVAFSGGTDRQARATAGYTAPERRRGQIRTQSDVYSLGAVGWWMLTGSAPDSGVSLREPARGVQGVPDAFVQVLLRCLREEPEKRYPDAGRLEEALLSCLPE